MNILLIDPHPESLKECCENLSILGYSTEAVQTATDAVSAAQRLQPGLVVLSCLPPLEAPALLAELQALLPSALFIPWAEKPKVALVLQLLNTHHIHAFSQERPDMRTIMMWAAEAEKKGINLQEREAQHSRLALEYAKLKQAYDDLRGRV
ncbi:MAG TPA: hypothetical protein PKO06_06850 [Candidatus Ozemobacteraceae bacterium]|nr:hypothetical protein [Candidatus Ozemobacteraceae bacterium]